jgi:tetraacyldisaccharide 4'-kinase
MSFTQTVPIVVPRGVLRLLSWPYAAVVTLRNKAFDWGVLKTASVHVPVISVGNMTAGGTGKTPLVEYIVRYCLMKGKRVAVVSRGYRRDSRGLVVVSDGQSMFVGAMKGGDEPVQIARKFPGAIVVVGERRVDAARVAAGSLGAEVVVLDDGFQHRYLRRDLDFVVVDSRGLGVLDSMLPAGKLREPWSGIRRADLVAVSKVDMIPGTLEPDLSAFERWYNGPVIQYRYKLDCVCKAPDGARIEPETMKSRPALAVSGIGDPDGFIEGLSAAGFVVKGNVAFPDHHRYTPRDVNQVIQAMQRCGAEVCVTTEKDIVRMMSDTGIVESLLNSQNVFFTCISVDVVHGEHELHTMLDSCIEKNEVFS